jgi:hypothetical protein
MTQVLTSRPDANFSVTSNFKMTISTKYILLTTSLFSLLSCGQQTQTKKQPTFVADNYEPVYSTKILSDKLEIAFKQISTDTLGQIFLEWNKNVKPNTTEFIEQNDTIKAVFDVYKEFYKPLDLLKLGDWEWGNDLNSNCKYVVVQNKIFYAVMSPDSFDDFSWRTSHKDSINNFRPPLNIDSKKVLYLTTEYDKALNQFLGTESTEMGTPNIMNPSRPEGESEKRYEIIRPFIPVLHGHWGGYWHLETHPDVGVILLDKTLTKAKIDFRVGYQGGEATLEKQGNKWIIKKSKATWVE